MSAAPADSAAVLEGLADFIREAAKRRTVLAIEAGGSKSFYGNPVEGERLDPRVYRGVVAYEPTELVITARAGTPLAEIETLLAAHGQMLAFEPPHFGSTATLGGCIAAGLAGPRRCALGPASGAVRESVLGAKLLDGRGALLSFGGAVMKNVAGYDVARLLAGSLGTLGVIVEVSLRVVPRPAVEETIVLEADEVAALAACVASVRKPWPVSATAAWGGRLALRLSGAAGAVSETRRAIGGEVVEAHAAAVLWQSVREQSLPLFSAAARLWRVAVPVTAPPLGLGGEQLIEWRGGQRWIATDAGPDDVRARATALRGHATLFRGDRVGIPAFTPLAPTRATIEARLRAQFDPAGIFNRGRMHADPAR